MQRDLDVGCDLAAFGIDENLRVFQAIVDPIQRLGMKAAKRGPEAMFPTKAGIALEERARERLSKGLRLYGAPSYPGKTLWQRQKAAVPGLGLLEEAGNVPEGKEEK